MAEWIPTKTRLPQSGLVVLGCLNDDDRTVKPVRRDYWFHDLENDRIIDVVAWQPMPAHVNTPMADKKFCEGCRDNFYNGNNPLGVKECWAFSTAKVVTRYRLSIHTPMNQRDGYEKMETHHCRKDDGYIFVDQIPKDAR